MVSVCWKFFVRANQSLVVDNGCGDNQSVEWVSMGTTIDDGEVEGVESKIPYQCLSIKQVLHQLPVLNGSATKYSHLGRYCTFLLF